MSIPKRNSDPAAIRTERTFFVTSAAFGHRAVLQSDRRASLLIDVLVHYRNQDKYLLYAFVVMPDHFHGLLTVRSDVSIERAMQFIKGGFSFRVSGELGSIGEVWQKGFSEASIRDFQGFCSAKNYIHQNPVRRGLCHVAEEYPYSSANGQFPLDRIPQRLKPLEFAADFGTPDGVP